MKIYTLTTVIVVLINNTVMTSSIEWLSVYRMSPERLVGGKSRRSCRAARRSHGFTKGQLRACMTQYEVMPHVGRAAHIAVVTCQRMFRRSRWNCSSILNAPHHTPDLTQGTREQAVVSALSSAALTWSVSRACSQGTLILCGCGRVPQEPPNGPFKWGGCADNILFGTRFSRDFLDVRYIISSPQTHKNKFNRRRRRGVSSEKNAASWVMISRHHREARPSSGGKGLTRFSLQGRDEEFLRTKTKKKRKRKRKRPDDDGSLELKPAITIMNNHNNRVGRRVVEASLSTYCKCHGVSGSCSVKTCWRALPVFMQAGKRLYLKYHSGVEVREVMAGPRLRLLPASAAVSRFSRDDLIYIKKSPDYCHPEPRLGSLGTRGRRCNSTSRDVDGCDLMCCGRGYVSQSVKHHQRCYCKYHWCCYVTCQTCAVWQDVHTCN